MHGAEHEKKKIESPNALCELPVAGMRASQEVDGTAAHILQTWSRGSIRRTHDTRTAHTSSRHCPGGPHVLPVWRACARPLLRVPCHFRAMDFHAADFHARAHAET